MKIGIITFHSAHNYGAVLQAWSLQEYLRQQGHQVEIVNLRLPAIDKIYRLVRKTDIKVCGNSLIDRLVNGAYYQLRFLYHRLQPKTGKVEKYRKFERFITRVLPVTEEFGSYEELCQADLSYDALIAGSDQIWNTVILKNISPAYFLQFANKDALRISYAASIGTEEIEDSYKMVFRRYLREFDFISVREKKAQEEVAALTDKEVELVADPTFLLERGDFDRLMKKPRSSRRYIYVHNVHLNRVDEALNSVVEEMSERLGLPVIHNWASKVFSNEAGHFTGGAEEFLGLVASADYVITNSFHCTVFAVIFQKGFITVPHYKHPDRMRNLLESLGIPEHLISRGKDIPEDLEKLAIDYQAVEEKRSAMGAHARGFLKKALAGKKEVGRGPEDGRTYLEDGDIFRCYGCGTCKDVCPAHAISMEEDREGFVYPVIDEAACTQCGRCKEACIVHQREGGRARAEDVPAAYAAYHKEKKVVRRSTNGGVYTALYRAVLKKGGVVAGVRFDEDLRVVYGLASDEEGCRKFCGFKPVFADSGDIKPQVREVLERDGTVLFTGTPCQVAALKSFLGRDYPGLYTVEFVCDGGGSPKVFRKYRDYLEGLYRSKIVDIQFNNKFKGAATPFVVTEFASGSVDVEDAAKHDYNNAYREHKIQRPSCYTCAFVGKEAGVADLALGCHPGDEDLKNPGGISMVRVFTEKGKALFDQAKGELEWREIPWEKACEMDQRGAIQMGADRSRMMSYIDERPIEDLLLTFNRSKKGGIKNL